jgi:hypothetical protein
MALETMPLLSQHGYLHEPRPRSTITRTLRSLRRSGSPTVITVALIFLIVTILELLCQSIALGLDISFDNLIGATPSTPKLYAESKNTHRRDWSPGNAFSAIFMLQLSCFLQPAGSSTLEASLSTWRFSPVYCAIEAVRTLRSFYDALISRKMSISSTALAVGAARYRSYRPVPQEGGNIQQDIEDVQHLMRRRRLFATLNGILVIFQFVKVVSVSGRAGSTTITYILGGIYFVYWAVHELIAEIVRFPRRISLDLYADGHKTSALYHSELAALDDLIPSFPFFAGLLHIGTSILLTMTVFGIGNGGLLVHGHHISPIANCFLELGLLASPILAIYFCLWYILPPTQDHQHRSGSHAWYTLQGLQSCVLILLYYICIFDSTKISRPDWLDWLGKV